MIEENAPVTEVLVVCEANRARSPVLAQLLRREAERRGLEGRVTVTDAGLRARPGETLLPTVDRVARKLGLDLEEHRTRLLDPADATAHGLVLTMTEEERREIVRRQPHAISRTFTVREALRLLDSRPWDPRWEGTTDLAEQLHRVRPVVPAARGAEDVTDPARGGRHLAGTVVAELQRSATRLAIALWGPVPPGSSDQTPTVGR